MSDLFTQIVDGITYHNADAARAAVRGSNVQQIAQKLKAAGLPVQYCYGPACDTTIVICADPEDDRIQVDVRVITDHRSLTQAHLGFYSLVGGSYTETAPRSDHAEIVQDAQRAFADLTKSAATV